jgi:hypothetical protein
MISPNRRRLGGLVVAVVLFSSSPGAQRIGRSFDELPWVLKLGQLVGVTNESGWEIKGQVDGASASSLLVLLPEMTHDPQEPWKIQRTLLEAGTATGQEADPFESLQLATKPVTTSARTQGLRFGVKVDVPLTTYFETGQVAVRGGVLEYSSATRRYTLGPSAEWRLKPRVGLEFDALHKRIGFVRTENTSVSGVTIDSSVEVSGNSWDFPMMAKYRWDARVAPYVASGFVLRYMGWGRARGGTHGANGPDHDHDAN